jgi:RNA polymerase sigma-70 factor (ECF subfamily)
MRKEAELPVGEVFETLQAALVDAEPALMLIAARLCGNSADASDLVQDTLERAMRQGIPAEVRSTCAWLTTIMHNLFVDRCRAATRRPRHQCLEDLPCDIAQIEPDVAEPAWDRLTVGDIREALDAIEQVYRDVYNLHTFEHLSYEQIARQLSIQRITVGTRLSRARKKLRAVLVNRFGLEEGNS